MSIISEVGLSIDLDKMKKEIQELIDKYERFTKSGKIDSLKEEETKKDFIIPLFEILGWDVYNKKSDNEVSAEEKTSKGFVDHGFRINDIPQFFLEAKSFKAGVDRDDFAFQAINYSYNKGTTWAVLTNFRKIRIFNAQVKEKLASSAQFFTLEYSKFLTNFDQLLLLSREGMKLKLLDKQAEKWGKKIRKSPIDKQLLFDLTNFRSILSTNIKKNNKDKNLSHEEIEESVQKILDRLIFIRTVEDREVEPPILKPLILENNKDKLWIKLSGVYKEFDDVYDSTLFASHLCSTLVISDQTLEEVIRGLYETIDKTIQYDFAAINADVLGSMYEQYLGHISKKIKVSLNSSKRKEHGIYYTPTYVVDYIVKNTVDRYIKENPTKYKKMTIIDPACGSGSFLLRALDHLLLLDIGIDKRQSAKDSMYGKGMISTERMQYMKNCIHGVDLDPQAVEITQLNLMLRVAEKKERLPTLRSNIKEGNSLISDSTYSKNNLDWASDFESVPNGKFDVVIGNPPYFNLQTISDSKYKEGLKEGFPEMYTGQNDILYFFYALGTRILKEGGYLGFITSRYLLEADFAKSLRIHLKENTEIVQIIDFGSKVRIFEDASINTCIIIYKNIVNPKQENIVDIIKVKDWNSDNLSLFEFIKSNSKKNIKNEQIEVFQKPQKQLSDHKWTLQSEESRSTISKLEKNSKPLGEFEGKKGICKVFKSLESGLDQTKINEVNYEVFRVTEKTIQEKDLEREALRPLIKNGMIRRYTLNYTNEYLIFTTDETKIDKFPNIKKHLKEFQPQLEERYDYKKGNFEWWRLSNLRNIKSITSKKDKIMVPMIAPENRFIFVHSDDYICTADVYVLILEDNSFDFRYVQGVLNSKLMNLLVKKNSKAVDGSAKTASGEVKRRFSYSVKNISNLPIKIASKQEQKEISDLVIEIESLHKELAELQNKDTSKKEKIQEHIEKIDSEIDNKVFKLYDITPEEIEELS
ncbi:putative type I restriction enzyme MjaXP M protein [Marine Group I thaumarchaeote SCGC RSA3]|uniref:site-specific DNA-methyltransferase (adenine-specific) n=2 Tax=Marine Group I TaxID=905826 RepID=A0A081RNL4_9ARCH|nr:Modification methylase BstVI protein [Marine Group I thaumarchaeote SCGC AAA799-N04]KFM15801.1 putative type I restriction enzyme MjaXP M protein [Marine Group I thaumarchaeote SCGC RSA3]